MYLENQIENKDIHTFFLGLECMLWNKRNE